MTTLVQIFSIPGQDSNSTMKDATDKESGLKIQMATFYSFDFLIDITREFVFRQDVLK